MSKMAVSIIVWIFVVTVVVGGMALIKRIRLKDAGRQLKMDIEKRVVADRIGIMDDFFKGLR